MEYFNPKVFKLSSSLFCEKIITPHAPITLLRNFYEDLGSVLEELNKLPACKVGGTYEECNGSLFVDARKSYVGSMEGTHLPVFKQLRPVLKEALNLETGSVEVHNHLLVNCFQKYREFPNNEVFYGAHTDVSLRNLPQVAVVVFLNESYEKGEGMNFYSSLNFLGEPSVFTSSEESPLAFFQQGEPNMGVLFDANYPHGQASGGPQFENEWRYTQVIFSFLQT